MTVNPQLEIDEHPMLNTDELFSEMAGCCLFGHIDLVKAYLQLEVDEESAKILTLNTHRGLYKCKRLMESRSSYLTKNNG